MKPLFDPTDSDFLANPYPTYKRMREEQPIFYYSGWNAFLLTRYEDVNPLLRDKRLGRVLDNAPDWDEHSWQFEQSRRGSLLEIEPPDHTRIKDVFHQTFTPKRVRELGTKIEALCNLLVDRLLRQQGKAVDLLEEFAQPIPVTVIADLLGIPHHQRDPLVPWSKGIIGWFEPERSAAMEAEAIRCATEFMAYLRELIPIKRAEPTDDLMSAMIAVHDSQPERLSENELINNCILLLNAGHEAVVNVIGNGLKALLSNPTQWELLKSNPAYIPTTVEEMMRYDTPLQFFERLVLEPLEYKGQRWERGTKLCLYYAAANHDPATFANPTTFDITRDPNPHLAFGLGLHYCIGAPLARVELQTALRILVERLPNLRLAEGEKLEYVPKNVFRYLNELKVEF